MLTPIIVFLIAMVYATPSVIAYFLLIYIILKYKKSFDSSFFQLFIYDGILNLFTYFVGFYMMRLSSITCYDCILYPIYRNADKYFPMNFLTAMSYHMAYVQYSTTAVICLNRLSVLVKYNFWEPIWKSYGIWVIVIMFLVPFLDTSRCFFYKTTIVYVEDSEMYALSSPMMRGKIRQILGWPSGAQVSLVTVRSLTS
uniref:Serpentine receptor class gamma n=1 Tax=Caenorhabditis tropicalis TaxID=1561998 RepID=A0A1I7T651_9PELO